MELVEIKDVKGTGLEALPVEENAMLADVPKRQADETLAMATKKPLSTACRHAWNCTIILATTSTSKN